ncbi:MAG: rhamnosidase, partial [Clostridiales bacterium]|nr:rhamnosidase [Clostridiales bacterium]
RGLGRMGKYETLYRLLTRTDEHGWRNMLREGATACFEAWGKDQKWNTSLCHPWASGAIPLMVEELAGLRPDPDSSEGVRFEPHLPEGLDGFALRVPFRGSLLNVTKRAGERPALERMELVCFTQN